MKNYMELHKMSPTEKRAMTILIKNHDRISTMKELIDLSGVGYSTIYSILKRTQFKSFKELIYQIKVDENNRFSKRNDMMFKDNELFMENIHTLEVNLLSFSRQNFDHIVELICKANTIHVVGAGYSGAEADVFIDKLSRMGFNVYPGTGNIGRAIYMTQKLTPEDLLICFSLSAETPIIKRVLSISKKRKTPSILVSANKDPLIKPTILSTVYEIIAKEEIYYNTTFPLSLWIQYVLEKLSKKTPHQ